MQQDFPDDLLIEGTAGSLVPGEENYSVEIHADGSGSYEVYLPDEPGSPIEEVDFELSKTQLAEIWRTLDEQDFFSLEPRFTVDDVDDGAIAILSVTANGRTHQVEVENAAVPRFERVLGAINRVTPEEIDLPYRVSPPDR